MIDAWSLVLPILVTLLTLAGIAVRERVRRTTLDRCLSKVQPGTRLKVSRPDGTVIEVSRHSANPPDKP